MKFVQLMSLSNDTFYKRLDILNLAIHGRVYLMIYPAELYYIHTLVYL